MSVQPRLRRVKHLFFVLFRQPANNLFVQIVRYCVAGGIAFTVDFGLCWLLTEKYGVNYIISAVAGALGGTTVSYISNVLWVFSRRNIHDRVKEITIFFTISIVGLVATPVLMWVFTEKAGFYYLISKLIVTVIVVVFNFIAKKNILFK